VPVVRLRDGGELGLGSHVVAGDAEHPRRCDQAGRHDELGLVAEVGVRLLALGQLRIIKHLLEDGGMGHGLVLRVDTVPDLAHPGAKVLENAKTWDQPPSTNLTGGKITHLSQSHDGHNIGLSPADKPLGKQVEDREDDREVQGKVACDVDSHQGLIQR